MADAFAVEFQVTFFGLSDELREGLDDFYANHAYEFVEAHGLDTPSVMSRGFATEAQWDWDAAAHGSAEGIEVGDRIAAAVLTYKHAALRVGVVEKIHPPTGSIGQVRYTIRDEKGNPFVVSSSRSIRIGDGFRV